MGVIILMSEYIDNIVYGIKSFITGMRLTWKHFSNKKDLVATLQYPNEKWPIPEKNIGFELSEYNSIRSRLHVDIDDCIACMQCERACPVDCIKIDSVKPPKGTEYDCGITSNDTQKKMIVSRFTIDMSECMYCNLCVYPCPEECIYMVGGPNEEKHPIDYEFSQYSRDGMIFEFADATDQMIKDAGGQKWLDNRDSNHKKIVEGKKLNGLIAEEEQEARKNTAKVDTPAQEVTTSDVAQPEVKVIATLEISTFNNISDKMCRGIAKKVFVASKRSGANNGSILADVVKAINEAGKMTDEIQSILNGISASFISQAAKEENKPKLNKDSSDNVRVSSAVEEVDSLDLKDLNQIEDKMTRGTAKKAFLAAKKTGENKIVSIKKALVDANLLSQDVENILLKYSAKLEPSTIEKNDSLDKKEKIKTTTKKLFDITDLNIIKDKVARGISKKTYIRCKQENCTTDKVVSDIKSALHSADKLSSEIEEKLNALGSI